MILMVFLAVQYLGEFFKVIFDFYKVARDVNFIELRHCKHYSSVTDATLRRAHADLLVRTTRSSRPSRIVPNIPSHECSDASLSCSNCVATLEFMCVFYGLAWLYTISMFWPKFLQFGPFLEKSSCLDLISFFDPLLGTVDHGAEVKRLNAIAYGVELTGALSSRLPSTSDTEQEHW
jgi:hypothetical protein